MKPVRAISRTCLVLLSLAATTFAMPPAARPYHVINYDITIQPSLPDRLIRGLVTLDVEALTDHLTDIELDASDMTILSVGQGRRPLRYVRANDILRVSLRDALQTHGKTKVTIRYEATPRTGVRFFNDQMYTVFATSHWLPCNDRPSDRALYSMHVIAPTGVTVVASGELISTRIDKGQTISTWQVQNPVSTYVFGFTMGRFTAHSDQPGGLPITPGFRKDDPHKDGGPGTVSYLVSPEAEKPAKPVKPAGITEEAHAADAQADVHSLESNAPAPLRGAEVIFSTTRAAAAFFAEKSGKPYPGKSYTEVFAHGEVAQEASQFTLLSEGYLAGLADHPDDSWLLAHELAHQWWGISVTCEDWSDFWLNEGMATYMADAFLEQQYGKERYNKEIEHSHQVYLDLLIKGEDRPLSYHEWTRPEQAGGRLPYHKGAWFLHLLRQRIGDDQFWRGLRQYTSGNWERSVSSHTFEMSLERACGCNLQNLFNQFVYAL